MKFSVKHFALVVASLLLAPASQAQDDAAKQQLVKAIRALEGSEISIAGSVAEDDAPEDDTVGGVKRVMITSIGGSSNKPFLGDFELLVNKGSVALVSKDEFPGIKILRSGDKVVNFQAHAEAPFSVDSLSTTVNQLVDWKALSEAVEKAAKIRVTKKDKLNSMRVILDTEFIPVETLEKAMQKKMGGAPGGNVAIQVTSSSLSAQIVDLVATFSVNDSGGIEGMTFDIQYNDPMKAMMAGAVRAGGGAAFRIGGNAPKPKEGDAVDLGKLVSFTFKVGNQPSERIKQFVKTATPFLQPQK